MQQLQHVARPLSRRRRHEDRLHLRLRLQHGGVRDPQRPPADRGRARRPSSAVRAAEGGADARERLQQRRPVVADALARHRRRAGADRRAAAQSARGDVRQASPPAGRPRRTTRKSEAARHDGRQRRQQRSALKPSCCRASSRPSGKFVLGRRRSTPAPPTVVFAGPADDPEAGAAPARRAKARKPAGQAKPKTAGRRQARTARAERRPSPPKRPSRRSPRRKQ